MSLKERMTTLDRLTECGKRLGLAPSDGFKLEHRLIPDLGFDSLDLVEMVMSAEEEFGIEIDDADAENFSTIREYHDYIEGKLRHEPA